MAATDNPGFRVIYEGALAYGIYAFIMFGLIATTLTIWYLAREDTTQAQKRLLLVAWGVIPPAWFLIEYFFVFIPYGVKDSFGYFQYGQNVASKLWAAVFALISVSAYMTRDKKAEKSTDKDSDTES